MKLPEAPTLRELNRDDEQECNLVLAGWLQTYVGTKKRKAVGIARHDSQCFACLKPILAGQFTGWRDGAGTVHSECLQRLDGETGEDGPTIRLGIERSVMYRLCHPVVKDLIARSTVVVATPADDAFVYGWVAFDGDVLHYVCVKPKWQRLGVASQLLTDFQKIPVTYTHKTADGMRLPLPASWTYAPLRRFAETAA